MSNNEVSIRFLGTRGSFPITDTKFAKYGGDTMCVLITYQGNQMLLDIGTGVTRLHKFLMNSKKTIPILISHAHIDHILGVLGYTKIYKKDGNFKILAVPRGGHSCKEQIGSLFVKPIWPLALTDLLSNIEFVDIKTPSFQIGDIFVEWIESNHPGGSSIYKLTFGGKQIVYATDFEHNKESSRALEKFSQGVDILFYDGQFTEEEYPDKMYWGHSTWRAGIEIARNSNIPKIVIIHHSPEYNDKILDDLQQKIDQFILESETVYPMCILAKSEEEFLL